MRQPRRRALVASALFLAACSTSVDATNPYDPTSANPKPGTVLGTVVAEGRLSPSGIRVYLEDGAREVSHGDSGDDGGFLIDGVAPGEYNVSIREDGFYAVKLFRIPVGLGARVDLGEIALQSLASGVDASVIRGSATFEGLTDHTGIRVAARDTTFSTGTAPDGSYSLTVSEGTYELQFSAPEWSPSSRAGVVVARGETITVDPVALLRSPATITGVILRRSCTAAPGAEPEPAEGALVSAVGSGATAVADSQGTFRLEGLTGGTWIVRATLAGQDPGDSLPVAVQGGATAAVAEPLVLAPALGAVVGHVLLATRVDHSGSLVQLTGVAGADAVTAEDGAFRISGVCAGEGYSLRARATQEGFETGLRSGISVLSGQDSVPVELLLAQVQAGLVLAGGAAAVNGTDVVYSLRAAPGTTEMRIANSDFLDPELGWVPFQESGPWTLQDLDGERTVFAQLRGDGALSAVMHDSVILDRVPPAAPAVLIEGGGVYSNDPDGAVTLTLTASDTAVAPVDRTSGLVSLKLFNHDLQGGAPAPSDPADPRWAEAALAPVLAYQRTLDHPLLRPNLDEEKELWVRFGDGAGNWSDPISAGVTLDREAPDGAAVEIVTGTPGFVNDSRVDLLLTVSDENPGVQVRLSGSSTFLGAVLRPVPAPPTVAWDLPQVDGTQTVWVQYADLAGNLGAALSATIELDTSAPAGVRLTIDQAPYAPSRDVELTLAAQSATEMVFSLAPDFTDAAGAPEPWLPFGGAHAFTLPVGDGPRVIYGKFRDEAHNESVSLSAVVTLDTSAPVVSAVEVLEGAAVPVPGVNLAVTALPGPLDAYELRIDVQDSPPGGVVTTGAWLPFNPAVPVTLPAPDGEKELQVRVRDAAGNVSLLAGTAQVTLDSTPPLLVAVELAAGAPWTSAPALILTVDALGADQLMISNRADFLGSVWQPLGDPQLPWTLPATDGQHTVFVRVRDLAGNEVAGSAAIGLDSTGPQPVAVTIDAGAAFSADTAVDLLLFATDALSGVVFAELDTEPSFTGAQLVPWGGAGSQPLAGFALEQQEGLHAVHVRFLDAAGNSSVASATIRVDTEPPAGTLTIDGGASHAQAAAVTLTLSAPADATRLKVVDGAVASCDPPLQFFAGTIPWTLPGADGPKSVSVCFVDGAGNSATSTASIVLDTQSPAGTVELDGRATHAVSRSVVLTLATAADVTGVALTNAGSLDCGTATYEPFSSPRSWLLSAGDGNKSVTACFRDGSGRTASDTGSIVLDTVAPTGSVQIDGGATYSRDSTVDLLLTAADPGGSGVAFADVALDASYAGAQRVAWAGDASQPLAGFALVPGDGPRTVYVRITDLAGNQLQASATVVVDAAPPAGTIAINGGAAYTQDADVTVTLSAPADTVSMRLTDGAVASCAAPLSAFAGSVPRTLPGADGPKQLSICFVDAAGNTATATADILLDTANPAGTASLDGGAATTVSRDVNLTLTAPADTAQMSIANAGSLDCATATYEGFQQQKGWTLTGGDGAKTVVVCFKDLSGRTASTTASIILDTLFPAATLSLAAGATYSTSGTVVAALTFAADVDGYAVANDSLDCSRAAYVPVAVGTTTAQVEAHALTSGEGTKSVVACVRDVAGNVSVASDSIVLDTERPTAEQLTLAPTDYSGSVTVTAILSVSGATEMCMYGDMVGGSSDSCVLTGWTPLLASTSLTVTATDGSKQVNAHFRDAAGNVSARAADSVILDRTAPQVAAFSAFGLGRDGANASVTRIQAVVAQLDAWTDVGSSIEEIQLSESAAFAGAAWQAAATSVPFSLSGGDGTKTVYGRARDRAGNPSVTVSATIVLDQTPPSGGTLTLQDGAVYTSAPAPHTISGKFYIGGEAIQWSGTGTGNWNNCATNPCASSAPGQTLAHDLDTGDGLKRLALFFRDEAGNVSAPVEDSILLDTSAPSGVRILSAAPRTTSIFVDLDDSVDLAPGIVDHYEVETRDSRGATRSFSFPTSEGWLTGLPALREYTLRARAVDGAQNPSSWLPLETAEDPAITTLVGLSPTVLEGVDVAPLASRLFTVRGISFFPSITPGDVRSYRLQSCDSRRRPCSESGFVTSDRDPYGGGILLDVTMAVQGGRLWLFGMRNDFGGNRRLEAFTTSDFDTAWDLNTWSYATIASVPGLITASTLAAATNGKVIAVAYADTDDTIAVQTCLLSGSCTTGAEWSAPLQVVAPADTAYRREEFNSISMDAGENHLWISYPANDGAPCAGGNGVCGVAVLGCAISENSTHCTAATDWNKVRLVNGGGFPRGAKVLEAEGYLWVAALLEPAVGAPPPEDGLWLWRCPVPQRPTADLCAAAGSFEPPVLLEPLGQVIEGALGIRPRVAFEAWSGSIYFGTFDYASLELTFGRCNQAQANCLAKDAGDDLVNFNRATVLRSATSEGEAKLGIHQGNPVLFLRRDDQRLYVLEPYTAAPIGRALVPNMSTGGVWASWLDRDAAATDGYRVSYDAPVRTAPGFDEVITTYSATDTSLLVSGSPAVDHFGIVGAFRGRDQSLAEPVFHARGGSRIEDTANLQPGAGPRYAGNGACHAVAWANADGSVQLSTCRRGGACDTAAGWNDLTLEAPRAGNVTVEDVALAIDPSSTRLHVAFAYRGEPEELWYSWRTLDGSCVPGAAVNELKLVDGAGAPVPDIRPTRLTLAATDSRVFLAYSRHLTPYVATGQMALASCDPATGCVLPGNWTTASFDIHYRGGALAVVGGDLYWASQSNSDGGAGLMTAELWRCPLASRCDAPGDFTGQHRVFTATVIGVTGAKPSMLLRSEEDRLLYSWGDDFAWCNEGGSACDEPEAWNRGWFSPDVLSQARPKIVLVGSVGNVDGGSSGDLTVLGLGNEGHGIARCTGRCWNPDSFLGGWAQLDGSTQYELLDGEYHFGQVGQLSSGSATVVTRSYDSVLNRHHWVFHDDVFLDVSQ